MKSRQKILDSLIRITSDQYPKSEVYLYGSRARGDFKVVSDWDLLILLDSKKITFDEEVKLMDEFYEYELESGEVISRLIYTKSEWLEKYRFTGLFDNIEKEGIRLK